eukprot:555649-Pelagomonas_calceolata.AAC.6
MSEGTEAAHSSELPGIVSRTLFGCRCLLWSADGLNLKEAGPGPTGLDKRALGEQSWWMMPG